MPSTPPVPAPPPDAALPWLLLCAVLATGSVLVWWAGAAVPLQWQRTHWLQQPWTLWTASLVHLSGAHLLANLLALGALAVLGYKLGADRVAALAWLLAWPLGTLALLGWPQVQAYSGLSGAIHAGVGVLCTWSAIYFVAKPWVLVLLAGLLAKLWIEQAWVTPVVFSPDWGFNVVLAAHLSGALCGMALGLALCAGARAANFAHQRRG